MTRTQTSQVPFFSDKVGLLGESLWFDEGAVIHHHDFIVYLRAHICMYVDILNGSSGRSTPYIFTWLLELFDTLTSAPVADDA